MVDLLKNHRSVAVALLCLMSVFSLGSMARSGFAAEPTNAKEAAEKKAREDAELAARFAEWKAALPPEQQAWETVLEQNLGGFYLPLYQKDKLAGRGTAWDYVQDTPGLPRVLLVGDSVSRGYTLAVRKALAGVANVHRAPENCGPAVNGIKKSDIWLADGKWDVIHFNFGIHDRRTPAADYQSRLEALVERYQKTGATVIWASTTPIPPDTKDGPEASAQIEEKNRLAAEVMEKHGVKVNDLYQFVLPRLKELQNPKDVHFSGAGYDALGEQVAKVIQETLAQQKK